MADANMEKPPYSSEPRPERRAEETREHFGQWLDYYLNVRGLPPAVPEWMPGYVSVALNKAAHAVAPWVLWVKPK